MVLHISSQAFPVGVGATQRGQKMKVGVFGGQLFELVAIVNVLLAARPEEQPETALLMVFVFLTISLGQQPVQHGAEGRDSGSGGDEHGISERRSQNKIAERSLKLDVGAFVETAQIVRHESIVHAVQAEGDVSV